MAKPGFRSERVVVGLAHCERGLRVLYSVDDRGASSIDLRLGHVDRSSAQLVVVAAAIYLGSLALARNVAIEAPVHPGLVTELLPVAEMIYDIRRWRDDLPLTGPPTIDALASGDRDTNTALLHHGRSVLAWSGGKDSTLSYLALRANGYDIVPVHATINCGVQTAEQRAVRELATLMGVPEAIPVEIRHGDFLDLSNSYATAWDSFPLSNRVPFGRDLLLYAIMVPIALRHGASAISLGHDHDCRTANVTYEGKRIPRNDLESSVAATVLEQAIQGHVDRRLRFVPPIANISELRVLRDMILEHPELMARTSFCFWGGPCGRCGKCLRYFLAERLYRPGLLHFEDNPLREGACPELVEILDDSSVLFAREVVFLLGRVAQSGDIRPGDDMLRRFADTRLAEVEHHLDEWEADLLREHPDPQLPPTFRPARPSQSIEDTTPLTP